MNEDLWDQTVEVATGQIAELQGATISDDTYRTDIAQAAVDALDSAGLDVDGSGYERRDITLVQGGE
jgi:hypothetical protein